MELSIMERLALLSILPPKAKIVDGRIILELKMGAGFSQAERDEINLRETPTGGIQWDKDPMKEVEVGKRAVEIIDEALKKLDASSELPLDCISLWDKIAATKGANA